MKRAGGFTLIEVVLTITIMTIISLLAIVNLSGSQAKARDEDRNTDVTGLVQRLDSLYRAGMTFADASTLTRGTYPTAVQMRSTTKRGEIFKDLDVAARTVSGQTPATDSILVPASSDNPATFAPAGTTQYAYIPLAVNTGTGAVSICEDTFPPPGECRRFIIRYRLETEAGSPLHEVRGKYQ